MDKEAASVVASAWHYNHRRPSHGWAKGEERDATVAWKGMNRKSSTSILVVNLLQPLVLGGESALQNTERKTGIGVEDVKTQICSPLGCLIMQSTGVRCKPVDSS